MSVTTSTFDVDRAWLDDEDHFEPFYVESTQPLEEALAAGELNPDTPVLVMEHDAGTLVFVRSQMAYHHVAQGELAGEPWLVTF